MIGGMVDTSGKRGVVAADVTLAFDDFFVAEYRPLLALATAKPAFLNHRFGR